MKATSEKGTALLGEQASKPRKHRVFALVLLPLVGLGLLSALLLLTQDTSAQAASKAQPPNVGVLSGSPISPISPNCGPDWAIVTSPNVDPGDDDLAGVAPVSSSDVWAVGGVYYDITPVQTLIEHWDGSAWSAVSSPSPGTGSNNLAGVTAVSSSDVWAVGSYSSSSSVSQTLIEHWNGSTWSVVTSPSPGTSDNYLTGVAAVSSSDVWAVGYYYTIDSEQTLIEHWNGSTWSVVTSLSPGTDSNQLYGVAAVSSSDVWAVGYYASTGFPYQTLIEHWNGSAWSVVPSPNQGTGANELYAVAAISSSDVWAVGYYYNVSAYQTLIEHWNGSAWSVVTSPNQGTGNNELYGVTAVSSSDVWAVGHIGSSDNQALIEHWNGTAWSVVSNPAVQGSNSLVGVAAVSSSDVWAAGSYWNGTAGRTLLERYNPCSTSCTLRFEDVPNPSTFYAYVQCLACRGIISGYSCGGAGEPCNPSHDPYFRPNSNVTRGQIAKIVALSAAINTPVSGQTFEDVPPGSTFYTYTEQLHALGVMSGYSCGGAGEPCNPPNNRSYFRPNANATRGQLAKIDSNAAGYNDPPSGRSFEDIPTGSTFYTYTQRLTSRGVMGGYTCGASGEPCVPPANLPYFRPNANVTRGQTSKIVGNAFFPDCQTPSK